MAEALQLITPDGAVRRRAMFAAEFLDPVTLRPVREGLRPAVRGLAAPVLNPSGRFVWEVRGPPAGRAVHIDLGIDNPMYGPSVAPLDTNIEANDGTRPPGDFLRSFVLTTTALYQPPAGMTAAAGRVVDGGGGRTPMAGVEVRIEVSHDGGAATFAGRHVARTDARGEFCVCLDGLHDEKPDPHATEPGALDAWLTLLSGGVTRARMPVPALRRGRLTRLVQPLLWAPDPP